MSKKTSRVWAFITTLMLALSGVVGLNLPVQPAKALSGSMFDPGLIIGDSVFYDFGTMDAPEIQSFLDQQTPRCKLAPAAKVGDFTCLRYYRTDIPAMAASDGRCNAIDAKSDVLASEMIAIIARACNINPRVILVTLQKEQGLVTSTNPFWPDSSGKPSTTRPADYRYQIAMGFACPDTGPCTTFGFFYQVYKAASQFHWYGNPGGSFTYLKVGKNVTIHYQVASVSNCGSRTFQLKSQATAALYYYTPYTPNQAALDNLYGSGDRCSAYGNRNFWRYYWDWFGSPIGGGFLLKSETSGTYLIVPNTTGGFNKYKVADASLVAAFSPLGPVGKVSQDYLDTFPDAGSMARIVKSATNNYYFVDNGTKYAFSSCTQAAIFGLKCTDAVQLTSYQLNALATGDPMSALVPQTSGQTSGPRYWITGGVKHEILDDASVTAAGLTLPALGDVPISAFDYLPWGGPIAKSGVLFTNRSSGNYGLVFGDKYYEIEPATSADMDFKTWFPFSTGTLSDPAVDSVRADTSVHSLVTDETLTTYALTPAGKLPLAPNTALTTATYSVPNAFTKAIPSVNALLTAPLLAKASNGKATYWIDLGTRRAVVNTASQVKLGALASSPVIQTLPASVLSEVNLGSPVLASGSFVTDPVGRLLLTDGLESYLTVANQDLATLYGLGKKPAKVAKSDLVGYTSEGALGIKVLCAGKQYLSVGGAWHPINEAYANAFPGLATVLDASTCNSLKFGTTELGRFVISPAKLTYLISNGKRRLVNEKQYALIRGTTPAAFKIDATLANLLPIGTPMPANYKTVLANPLDAITASPSPSPSVSVSPSASASPKPSTSASPTTKPSASASPSVKPSASASPTVKPSPSASPSIKPSPTPTATPTATPAPTASAKPASYIVVSGDTLTKIANRFSVTVAALKSANGLTSDVIKLGQKLIIP
mgnify:FL=1